MKVFSLVVLLMGCTASFQPFPSGYSKHEVDQMVAQLQVNDKAIAEAIVKLQPTPTKKGAK